jgi:hypothetical protein
MQRTDLFGVSYTRGVRAKLEHAPPSVRRSWVEVGPSLRWVLEDSGEFPDLPELDQLTPKQVVELGGGVDAATYLVRCPRRDVVVKLKSDGLEAEARALRAWQRYTPHVPDVLGLGAVPSVGERSMKYLLLAALKNDEGRIVEPAAEYLDRPPWSTCFRPHAGRAVRPRRAAAGRRPALQPVRGPARGQGDRRVTGTPPLDRTLPYTRDQHEIHRFLEVVSQVGAAPVTLEPRLEVTATDRAEAAAALAEDDRPLVVLHPGANDPRRRWPVERLAMVGCELARKGARLAVVGTAAEQPLAGRLVDGLDGDAADLAGRLGLGGLAGLLEQAILLVGNDSGPRHLAAAVGTATVAVHWGVSLGSYGPL